MIGRDVFSAKVKNTNSNLAATMFAPGASQLMHDFQFSSSDVSSLTVSIYLLGYALGPSIWAPLSETYGRLPIYAASCAVYAGFTVGCAFSTNLGMFIAFRVLTGAAGSCPMALCAGTLADVFEEKDRGKWMGLFVLGPLAGPVVGPIAGGFIAETIGWRWVFRVILIAVSKAYCSTTHRKFSSYI
jgi:multidrug resistance protein